MSVVVTGASGHMGINLIHSLIAQNRSVRAMVHVNRQAVDGLDVEVAKGDVRDLTSLLDAFKGADVVYHLAAHISVLRNEGRLLESVNVTGTRNVVEACLRCGVRRLIHFSSIHSIAQTLADNPIDESSPAVQSRQCPPYDLSKAAAEGEICRGIGRGMDAVIVSPTAIIGPYDYKPSHFGEALVKMANGKLPALVDGGFNWVDARDVAGGAMQAEERASTGARYILSGHWVSLYDMAVMVEKITGVPAPRFVCPMWLARIGAPLMTAFDRLSGRRPLYTSVSLKALRSHRNISHRKATQELDYHPRPFGETLVDALRWFEGAGKLARPLKEKTAMS
ncbi:MAG TPA: NAD-dependent epimerase/dehydratase family protein [Dehalococcoidia bacterium]|nr:NAD-dependent epimerase/dehydratase family protein [Dehalococcoidia bacterium]